MARCAGGWKAWAAALLTLVAMASPPMTVLAGAQQPPQARQERQEEVRRREQRRRVVNRRRQMAWREGVTERRRANPDRFERSRRGEQVSRGQVIAIDPSPAGIAAMRRLGFRRLRDSTLGELGVRVIVLRTPPNMGAVAALEALQAADPQGSYELNHVFDPSQGASPSGRAAAPLPSASGAGLRLGMIDGGVSADHPALASARITARGFVQTPAASPHGTAVASILVGADGSFQGLAPGAELFAADVFGEDVEGGSAEAIAEALGWLSTQRVSVINISLEGPPNRLVEIVCRAAQTRGIILVAAVGNSGPSAPVAYPAAYPGVVAVTAVDGDNRVYVLANRGPQVAFATLGVDVEAASEGEEYEIVSGTSFAAPRVAAALALQRAATPQNAIDALARRAVDLGAPGRDVVYGFGRAL